MESLIDFLRGQSWRQEALCATEPHASDPSVDWFPESLQCPEAFAAARVCHVCPVRRECLDYAIEADERYGVWGGMRPVQRWDEADRRGKRPSCDRDHYSRRPPAGAVL